MQLRHYVIAIAPANSDWLHDDLFAGFLSIQLVLCLEKQPHSALSQRKHDVRLPRYFAFGKHDEFTFAVFENFASHLE
jgi:hypothetical protein